MRIFLQQIQDFIVKYPFLSGLSLLVVYFLPYIILGGDSYIVIHDNLDSEIGTRMLLGKYFFGQQTQVLEIMNGVPISSMPSGMNLFNWSYVLFSPIVAYLINDFIVRIVAFVGMFLLLKALDDKTSDNKLTAKNKTIAFIVSVIFMILPFYSIHGTSVTALPLLGYAFINFWRKKQTWKDYAIIILVPFGSLFILTGLYVCLAVGVLWLIDAIGNKKNNWSLFFALIIFAGVSLLTVYGLVNETIRPTFQTHRSEFVTPAYSFLGAVRESVDLFFLTQYHSAVFYTLPIIIVVAYAIFKNKKLNKIQLWLLGSIVIIVGLYFILCFINKWGEDLFMIKVLQWNRFYMLLPVLWMCLYFVVIKTLKKWVLIASAGLLMLGILYKSPCYVKSCLSVVRVKFPNTPTFNHFFAFEQMKEVEKYIAKPKNNYKIGSVGIFPGVTQVNGFETVDGYIVSYPVQYKHKFRNVIAGELDKSKQLKGYFDDWGSRCYLFSSELFTNYVNKLDNVKLKNFQLDTQALKQLNCDYIFSACQIQNAVQIGLKFERKFESKDSFYDLYLYSL